MRAITVKTTAISATFISASPNYADSAPLAVAFFVSPKTATVTPGGANTIYGDEIPALSGSSDFLADDGIVVSFDDYSYQIQPCWFLFGSSKLRRFQWASGELQRDT